LSYNRTEQ